MEKMEIIFHAGCLEDTVFEMEDGWSDGLYSLWIETNMLYRFLEGLEKAYADGVVELCEIQKEKCLCSAMNSILMMYFWNCFGNKYDRFPNYMCLSVLEERVGEFRSWIVDKRRDLELEGYEVGEMVNYIRPLFKELYEGDEERFNMYFKGLDLDTRGGKIIEKISAS